MSQLLIGLAVSIALFLLLILPHVDASVKGTLTSAGGHKCEWREKSRNNDKRDLRLNCKCKDQEGNNIDYTCYYVSYYKQCCQNEENSSNHYHDHEPAYYGQAADQLKALSYPCRGGTMQIALCDGGNFEWEFSYFSEADEACTVTQGAATACEIDSTKYSGSCSGAPSDSCPTTTLQALINAWIRSLKSSKK